MYRHHFCVLWMAISLYSAFFFFNDTATTEIYTLSLHDALPISCGAGLSVQHQGFNQTPVLIENCVFLRNRTDRKSTRLNSSHLVISYAVFCLKKKKPHTYLVRSAPSSHISRLDLLLDRMHDTIS